MDTTVLVLIIVVVVLVLVVAVGGFLLARSRRSQQLQDRFGPEYERSLHETGDRKAAEAQLSERASRHDKLDVRDLSTEERDQYSATWAAIQRGFVDDPVQSLRQADSLITDIMRTRGFPTDGTDRRIDDISVEHPRIAEHYRAAITVHDATERGTTDTEQQRRAVTAYRELVDALLGGDLTAGNRHAAPSTAKEQSR